MLDIQLLSENTLIIYFAHVSSEAVSARIFSALRLIRQQFDGLITDTIPAYTSLHLTYDPRRMRGESLRYQLLSLLAELPEQASFAQGDESVLEIPVYYHPDVGLDLLAVAEQKGLTSAEVIALHSERLYRVYALGFMPGFAYLGTVDERLRMPRHASPRLSVPAGSVAIAEQQTAVYPAVSPAGWQILGRTPLNMVNYQRAIFTPFQVGQAVRFVPISAEQFRAWGN